MKRISIISFLILASALRLFAQTPEMNPPELDVQLFVEKMFATQELDVDYSDLYETLLQFYTSPIDLNKTSKEELRSLYILNELQLGSYFDYIQSNGQLISIYELQSIPNFDLETINALLPFVSVNTLTDTRPLLKRILNEDNNYLLIRYERTLEKKHGYVYDSTLGGAPYFGDPNKLYMRFRTSRSNDFSFGFTAEKDAGENLIWSDSTNRHGMDFYSFHAQLKNIGPIANVIVGDYQIQHGQGLVMSAGFSVGKGSETITTVRRNELGLRPYTSAIESGFFRGAAATYTLGAIDITGFYSNRLNDLSINTDSLEIGVDIFETDENTVLVDTLSSTIQGTGFHRTTSEISNKHQIREQNMGGILYYQSKDDNLQLGASYIYTNYDQNISKRPSYYNQFDFQSKSNYVYGASGSYQWQNMNVFAEVAQSKSGGLGAILGVLASLTHKVDIAILLRHFDPDFNSLYGNAFGESTRNANESGIYWGLKYKHNTKWTFSAYYDKYRFPWLRYQVKSPSDGMEYLLKLEYKPQRGTVAYFQFREEQKDKNISDSEGLLDKIGKARKQNYIFNIDYPAADNITLKTRFQFSTYRHNNVFTDGFAIMQDASATLGSFNFSLRYALFNTEDYNNRQYVYEKDVLYAFSIPAYSGIGTRFYLVSRYKFTRNIQLQARYAITHYRDRDTVSSGNEEINGNVKQDVKVQLKISF